MDVKTLRSLKPELQSFVSRYLPLFGREENHAHAASILQGLLAGGERRNVENIAEAVDGGVVRTLQKFISQGAWDDDAVLAELSQHVVEVLGDEDAVLIVDETGFPKKGTKSVGVTRQYSGTLGRIDNCQVGVFVDYCSPLGHTLIDRRLFLPENWTEDRDRCQSAGIPEGVVFRTKPELATEMIERSHRAGVPFRWVAGDSVYGNSPLFLQTLRTLGKLYVVEVSSDARVWATQPEMRPMGRTTRVGGRPTTNPKPLTKPKPVHELLAEIPATAWKRIQVAEGSQGPRLYEYTELTVWFSEESQPTAEPERLLFRRSLGQNAEIKYQRSNAPSAIPLKKLTEVGGNRWCVEQDFQSGKGECGLDEYETRGWTGWHHHTALSLLALMFLALQKVRLEKKASSGNGSRIASRPAAPARPATMGRIRNRCMEPMAAEPKSNRKALPQEKKTRRIQAAE